MVDIHTDWQTGKQTDRWTDRHSQRDKLNVGAYSMPKLQGILIKSLVLCSSYAEPGLL